MTDKNSDQIKALYTELAKIAPSQDWDKILKVAKKSNLTKKNPISPLQLVEFFNF